MKKKQKATSRTLTKEMRAARRRVHFDNGGTLVEWRGGVATRIPNKRKVADKNAARGKVRNDDG